MTTKSKKATAVERFAASTIDSHGAWRATFVAETEGYDAVRFAQAAGAQRPTVAAAAAYAWGGVLPDWRLAMAASGWHIGMPVDVAAKALSGIIKSALDGNPVSHASEAAVKALASAPMSRDLAETIIAEWAGLVAA